MYLEEVFNDLNPDRALTICVSGNGSLNCREENIRKKIIHMSSRSGQHFSLDLICLNPILNLGCKLN